MATPKRFMHEGTQLSPCITSKVKYALGLKAVKPANKKTCSPEYWERVVKAVASRHEGLPQAQVVQAVREHSLYAAKNK